MSRKKALNWLEENDIAYELMEHDAVYTIEEMEKAGITQKGDICKNLFLRDAKGKNHFLVVVPEEARVDLAALSSQLGSTKLSFASAERLEKHLGLTQGSVSPLGVINDEEHKVTVAFDKKLIKRQRMGIHPNDNTASVWLMLDDLKRGIENLGNRIIYIDTK